MRDLPTNNQFTDWSDTLLGDIERPLKGRETSNPNVRDPVVQTAAPTAAMPSVGVSFEGINIGAGGCGTTSTPAGLVAPGPNANQCTVNLNGLPPDQYTTVTLNSVTDLAGNSGPVSAVMGLLVGDVNGDAPGAPGLVDSGDVFLVRQQTGQAPTPTTFRRDINANNLIDSGDVFLTRQQTGHQLPSAP